MWYWDRVVTEKMTVSGRSQRILTVNRPINTQVLLPPDCTSVFSSFNSSRRLLAEASWLCLCRVHQRPEFQQVKFSQQMWEGHFAEQDGGCCWRSIFPGYCRNEDKLLLQHMLFSVRVSVHVCVCVGQSHTSTLSHKERELQLSWPGDESPGHLTPLPVWTSSPCGHTQLGSGTKMLSRTCARPHAHNASFMVPFISLMRDASSSRRVTTGTWSRGGFGSSWEQHRGASVQTPPWKQQRHPNHLIVILISEKKIQNANMTEEKKRCIIDAERVRIGWASLVGEFNLLASRWDGCRLADGH